MVDGVKSWRVHKKLMGALADIFQLSNALALTGRIPWLCTRGGVKSRPIAKAVQF